MAAPVTSRARVSVDGKFFRLGQKKFYVKGLAYGPFAKNPEGDHFASREQTGRDFALIRDLGTSVLRVYHVPPRWFLDLAAQFELRLLIDIPWDKNLWFLDSETNRESAFALVKEAATACAGHPAVFALSIVNEIPADIVRWTGAGEVGNFIDQLVDVAKSVDPELLCTFGNFPPTEYLHARNIDFHCFNVYLHHQKPLENYLARLQMLADSKPLILGEFGIDSIREGEDAKCEILRWQIETAFRGGLAGAVLYSYTDDWVKDDQQIENWAFGITTRDRQPKASFEVVQRMFRAAPYFPLHYCPMVSVVVASYNADRTLRLCLDSLEKLNYPAYEVILVDDGSTDTTQQIASLYQNIRYIRHAVNQGLSVARNTGIQAARGEIIAFTDADCRADEDWLYYIVGDLLNSTFTGIGGPNYLPPDDSWIAAAVMASPGGPSHVMLTDRIAEHIPGCNMVFYKWALEEIGGFDPIFRKAGDDVDVCWRLQQRGYKIGFSPAGFVWHYRRSTVQAYLNQQYGYGEAEAMLVRKHPEYFNAIGGHVWRGRIYAQNSMGLVLRPPMIYHGVFGSGFFQALYQQESPLALMLMTSLEYHVLVTLPLFALGAVFPFLIPLAVASLLFPIGLCAVAAAQAKLEKRKQRFWSRPLISLLFLLQPLVRRWARYKGRLQVTQTPLASRESLDTVQLKDRGKPVELLEFKAPPGGDRIQFLATVLEEMDRQDLPNKTDAGWNDYDVEIYPGRWCNLQMITATEIYGGAAWLIRCRLRPRWSMMAHILFWIAVAFSLLMIGLLGKTLPWIALFSFGLIGLAWWLKLEEQKAQRVFAVFLEKVAGKLGMIKIDNDLIAKPKREPPPA